MFFFILSVKILEYNKEFLIHSIKNVNVFKKSLTGHNPLKIIIIIRKIIIIYIYIYIITIVFQQYFLSMTDFFQIHEKILTTPNL